MATPSRSGAAQGPHPPSEPTLGHLQGGGNHRLVSAHGGLSPAPTTGLGPKLAPLNVPALPTASAWGTGNKPWKQDCVLAHKASPTQHRARHTAGAQLMSGVQRLNTGAVTPAVILARTYVRAAARQLTGRVRVWAQERV